MSRKHHRLLIRCFKGYTLFHSLACQEPYKTIITAYEVMTFLLESDVLACGLAALHSKNIDGTRREVLINCLEYMHALRDVKSCDAMTNVHDRYLEAVLQHGGLHGCSLVILITKIGSKRNQVHKLKFGHRH